MAVISWKLTYARRTQFVVIAVVMLAATFIAWNLTSLSNVTWKIIWKESCSYDSKNLSHSSGENVLEDTASHILHKSLYQEVDVLAMLRNVKDKPDCWEVASNPKSYWRSQSQNGSLKTSDEDWKRIVTAFSCGILDPEFFSKSPVDKLYPHEKFYLSEPRLQNLLDPSNENFSNVSLFNSSSSFKVGDKVAIKIEMRDGRKQPKVKGGDTIRVWLVDEDNDIRAAAKVTDFNNGTYLAVAQLPWVGNLSVKVGLAHQREYLRAVLHVHKIMKTCRFIAAVFKNSVASETTPCYHTPVVPGFDRSELCNFTKINGSPWFCGRPLKSQLNCSDLVGTMGVGTSDTYPITAAEMELFQRSARKPYIRVIPTNIEILVKPGSSNITYTPPCNKVLPQDTWTQDYSAGYMYKNTWFPLLCHIPKRDDSGCFKNKKILILGDSNGRFHYYHFTGISKCVEKLRALTEKWHKPLLCVHEANNFSVEWDPHSNPFFNGYELAENGSLISSANAIDEIPSQGKYLIILAHYFHFTAQHISAAEFMLRHIKEALVRLIKRNPDVQVILRGPHVTWEGWILPYASGDMFGPVIMELEREIFDDIKNHVVFINPWDMTVAMENMNYHPACNNVIFDVIDGFMCGR